MEVMPRFGPRRTAHRRRSACPQGAGFTLVEVLIALVLLAVGLLALQALSLVAVRSAALAEGNSRAAAVATRAVEHAVERLRSGELVGAATCTLPGGDEVARSVSVEQGLARLEITVVPRPRGVALQPYSVVTHVYWPEPWHAPSGPTGCP
jgi:prepilin-type N-terminal cleavage/methylation domain-containing protein